MLDFFFYYKNITRFIIFLKKSKFKYSFFDITEINKSMVFFNIKNITDLNNLSVSNYFFFFKYFFGKIPFFLSYNYNFKLNISYYSFTILCNLKKKEIYYMLFFFFNDIYSVISKNGIILKKELNCWIFVINDMNFFVEKKNSIGFFNLKDTVNFKFIFNKNNDWLNYSNFFKIYKL
jgi:hypothetical protein